MKTIVFNENCDGWHKTDYRMNELFLIQQTEYIIYRFRHYGYIYLNDIYEVLGAKWNPDDKNFCFKANVHSLQFDFEPNQDKSEILVKIY